MRERFIQAYVHNGRIGVLLELSLEYLTTTQTEEFVQLAKDLAMHIAACSPNSIDVLMEQSFVKDPSIKVSAVLSTTTAQLRDRVLVSRFVRWDTEYCQPDRPHPPDQPAVAMRFK